MCPFDVSSVEEYKQERGRERLHKLNAKRECGLQKGEFHLLVK